MVYCGKPSTACHECRKRRTRCNEARPSCSQCIRARRVCSGYRDPLTLMFRDENQRHTNKGGQNENQTPIIPREEVVKNLKGMQCNWKVSSKPKPRETRIEELDYSLLKHSSEEEQGICFVFRNYVFEDEDNGMMPSNERVAEGGLFGYLPGMFGGLRTGFNGCLDDAVIALGLAGVSNTRGDILLMKRAAVRYASAVSGISALLPEVKEATRDEVLVSVLLLGLYETNCSSKPSSLRYWSHHTNGASSLLSLRGDSQLQTPTGRRIFEQIRTQSIKSSLQRRIPVSDSITRLSLLALPHQSPSHAATTRLSFIVTRFAALRSNLPPTSDINPSTDLSHVSKTMKAATEIDLQLENWATNLPPEYEYETIQTPKTDREQENNVEREIYGEEYHIYPSIFHASTWNSYRCIRILVLEQLLTYFPYTLSPDIDAYSDAQAQIKAWRSKIWELSEDVLASVPYHFNTHIRIQKKLWTRPPPRALNGELLMWNLYSCAVSGLLSRHLGWDDDEEDDDDVVIRAMWEIERKRSWICARLRAVAREMGILHAEGLAIVVENGREVSFWERERMVASLRMGSWTSSEDSYEEMKDENDDWGSDGVTRESSPLC